MKKLLFIINPKAGRTTIRGKLFEIIELFSENGYEVTVHPTTSADDAKDTVIREGKNYDLLVAAGGDGTLDNVVSGMVISECQVPLGYIPSGTTNDFARSLDIPREPLQAANNIIMGFPYSIDVGSLNGDYFVYVAAFGAFTEVSYSTPQVYKNYIGHAAYVLEGIKSIANIKGYNLTVESKGNFLTGNYMYGMITNSLSVGGFKRLSSKYVEFDDGLFEVLLIKTPQTPMELQSIMSALLMNEINDDYMVSFKSGHVKITCDEKVSWTIDGEDGGYYYESEIMNHQKSVNIIIK